MLFTSHREPHAVGRSRRFPTASRGLLRAPRNFKRLPRCVKFLVLFAFTTVSVAAEAPLVWPPHAVAGSIDVRAATERFTWESAHFKLRSDIALPLGVVRDLAAVFEATRAVLIALPLGLHSGDAQRRYPVRLFATSETYAASGGAPGSGGFFSGREMLILLPNLGIKSGTNGLTTEHTRQLFILKHEVTHQLLQRWSGASPMWLEEGFAECVASWPYTQGRYTLRNLDAALVDYLGKWKSSRDRRKVTLIPPSRLMALSREDWRTQVAAQTAYDHYNSAALLTHYFLRHDDRGDGAHLAAYFAALRRGTSPIDAEGQHLLRGRTRELLDVELQKLARRLGLELR